MNLKFVDGSDTEIEGLLLPFYGPFGKPGTKGKDITDEYFSPKTDFVLSWGEKGGWPLLYHHGIERETNVEPIGRITSIEVKSDVGGWMTAQIQKNHEYYEAIKELIESGKVGLSSGAMPHLVRKDSKSGEILRWPVVEGSITPQPANPLAFVEFSAAKSHYKSAGLDPESLEELKAKMDAADRNSLPDSAFAYIDKDGNRKLPVNDAAHARDALSRWSQTQFESEEKKQAARRKILAACRRFGIHVDPDAMGGKSVDLFSLIAEEIEDPEVKALFEEAYATKSMEGSYEDLLEDLTSLLNPPTPFGTPCYNQIMGTFPGYVIVHKKEFTDSPTDLDDTYWKVFYTMGDNGEPVLTGKDQQVEQTYLPTKAVLNDGPLSLSAISLSRHAEAFAARTQDVQGRRAEEGRVFSTGNRQTVVDATTRLSAAVTTLQTLLDANDRMVQDQAKAAALASPDGVQRRLQALDLFLDTIED